MSDIETPQEEVVVDLTKVIEDLTFKTNLLSKYSFNLLKKVNDLYMRLEINSQVVEELGTILVGEEKLREIINKCVENVKTIVDNSPLLKSDDLPV